MQHQVPLRPLKKEILYYISLAIPMLLSLGTEPVMHFFDRLFLSHYIEGLGELYIASSLTGGIFAFLIISFFYSTVGYSNTMVAQHYGAQRKKECGKIATQSILLSLYVFPFVILISFFLQDIFSLFHHPPLQEILETQYSRILLWGSIFPLLKSALSGFFIGIGHTHIVMLSSVAAMLINIPLNYVCIFGFGIVPPMGIQGAALATVISGCISVAILLRIYRSHTYHAEYHTRTPWKIYMPYMNKLLRYGIPVGAHTALGVGVFAFFLLAMSSYGAVISAAVTIAINWDSMFFIPMLGASFATTTITGQYMGDNNTPGVIRICKISLMMTLLFVLSMTYLFLFQYHALITPFLDKMNHTQEVYALATSMLRFASIYLVMDGISLVLSAVLIGAGDTKAHMLIQLCIQLLFGIAVLVFIMPQRVTPWEAWLIFIGFPTAICIGVVLRYIQGTWKSFSLVD